MAIHSSILAWRIPWTEEPGGLQSMDSQRSWARLSDYTIAAAEDICLVRARLPGLGLGLALPVQLRWGLSLAGGGWGWGRQGVPRPHLAAGVIRSAEAVIGFGQIRNDTHAPDFCGVANEGLLLLGNQAPGQRRHPGQPRGLQRPGRGAAVGTMVAPGCSGLLFWGWPLHWASVWRHRGL